MDLSHTVHWLHSTVQSQSGNLFSFGYSHCQSLMKAAYCSGCALCVKHRCQGCRQPSRLWFHVCIYLFKKWRKKQTNKHRRVKVVRALVFACVFWKNNWWIRFNQMGSQAIQLKSARCQCASFLLQRHKRKIIIREMKKKKLWKSKNRTSPWHI